MVGRVLFEVALLVTTGVAIGFAVEWLRPHVWDLQMLIRSTLLFRRIRAEARSRTPGGSDVAPDGRGQPPSRATQGTGGELPVSAAVEAPPVPSSSEPAPGGTAWRNTLVGATRSHTTAPTRVPAGAGATPPNSPALAGLDMWHPNGPASVGAVHPHLPSASTEPVR